MDKGEVLSWLFNTLCVLIYNSFDFFVKFDRLVLFIFLAKMENFKVILTVYYMLDYITVKINNIYDFFNKTSQ